MTIVSIGPVAGCRRNPTSCSAPKIDSASSEGELIADPYMFELGDQWSVKLYVPVSPVLSSTGRPTPDTGCERKSTSELMEYPWATDLSLKKRSKPVSGLPSFP